MTRYFEFIGPDNERGTTNSSKFWQVRIEGNTVYTQFGKIGSRGQQTIKEFADFDQARQAVARSVSEKVLKGYVELPGGAPPATESPEDSTAPSRGESSGRQLGSPTLQPTEIPDDAVHPLGFQMSAEDEIYAVELAEALSSWVRDNEPRMSNGFLNVLDTSEYQQLKSEESDHHIWSVIWLGETKTLCAGLENPDDARRAMVTGFVATARPWTERGALGPIIEHDFECPACSEQSDEDDLDDLDDCEYCDGETFGSVDIQAIASRHQ